MTLHGRLQLLSVILAETVWTFSKLYVQLSQLFHEHHNLIACLQKVVTHRKHFIHVSEAHYCVSKLVSVSKVKRCLVAVWAGLIRVFQSNLQTFPLNKSMLFDCLSTHRLLTHSLSLKSKVKFELCDAQQSSAGKDCKVCVFAVEYHADTSFMQGCSGKYRKPLFLLIDWLIIDPVDLKIDE